MNLNNSKGRVWQKEDKYRGAISQSCFIYVRGKFIAGVLGILSNIEILMKIVALWFGGGNVHGQDRAIWSSNLQSNLHIALQRSMGGLGSSSSESHYCKMTV